RVGRRRGQPAIGRRVRDRPGRAGRGGGPGRGGDPPTRPDRPRALGLEHSWPDRSGRGQDRRGVLLYSLRCALAAPETARGLRRMVLTPLPCLCFPRRLRRRRSSCRAPRRPSCSPCTALTLITAIAAELAGSPLSWPRRRGCL